MTSSNKTINAMTVDVEDYFQVSAFEPYISRKDWRDYEGRVEPCTDRILDMFSKHNVSATFFTLGWVAQKYPDMVRRIVSEGHKLASHGWDHRRVTTLTREEFSEDIHRAKVTLEDVSGTQIVGYRAPSYSFTLKNDWAHTVLSERGHQYSSSIAPIRHTLYGIPTAPRFAYRCANDSVLELPITTTRMANKNYPCGGGGWFRLYPYAISKWAINRVVKQDQERAIFYFHPWEIDPDQPRIDNINLVTRFRHYQNLGKMEPRLERLLADFEWDTIERVFASELQQKH